MIHALSTRGKYAIATLLFIFCAIILTMFVPFTIFETLYNRSDYIVLIMPYTNIQYFIYAMVAISFCLLLLTFIRKWYTYLLASTVVVAAITFSSLSVTGYLAIEERGISKKHLTNEQRFLWGDIDNILFEYENGDVADYIVTLKDGSTFVFPHTGSIGNDGKRAIYKEAVQNNIAFVEKRK